MKLEIQTDHADQKFFTLVEDRECHLCFEILPEGSIRLTSTYVPGSIRTKGIASEMARYAFEFAEKENLKVIPRCGFIRRFVDKHPHFKSLLKDPENY